MKRQYFGTDGVRGPYGGSVINENFAWRLGVAAACWLLENGAAHGASVLIGRDTRASGASLGQALADGLACGGCQPCTLDVLPTPAVARAMRTRGSALGVVITASHNPAADNGIKFFGPQGHKLSDEQEARLEVLLPEKRYDDHRAQLRQEDGVSDYVSSAMKLLPARLDGWKIVLDTANGATVHTSGRVLRELGAEVFPLGAEPDGRNINEGVGSEHPEKMSDLVKRQRAAATPRRQAKFSLITLPP